MRLKKAGLSVSLFLLAFRLSDGESGVGHDCGAGGRDTFGHGFETAGIHGHLAFHFHAFAWFEGQ